ncbi:MAG: hypothetical protein SPF91_04285, partial [Clostridium sp.]|nr:hypothetical protein [Clostridium sp.]
GFLMIMEKGGITESVARAMEEKFDAKRLRNMKSRNFQNDRLNFYIKKRGDTDAELEGFLRGDDYVSVLLQTGGRGDVFYFTPPVLCLEERDLVQLISGQNFVREIDDFENFIVNSQAAACSCLKFVKESAWYLDLCDNLLFCGLRATISLMQIYLVQSQVEEIAAAKLDRAKTVLNMLIKRAECVDDDGVFAIVRDLLEDYLSSSFLPVISSIDAIDDEMVKAMEENRALLFDDDFYYIPDQILKQACAPLLCERGFYSLKNQLVEEGVIIINKQENPNYTIKKQVRSQKGKIMRGRFLKLSREKFVAEGKLTLEEVAMRCKRKDMSESMAENEYTRQRIRKTDRSC